MDEKKIHYWVNGWMWCKSGECYSSSRNIAEVTCLECLRIAADKALDPLNCIKPEWHERQRQSNEAQNEAISGKWERANIILKSDGWYCGECKSRLIYSEKHECPNADPKQNEAQAKFPAYESIDLTPELTEDGETMPFDPETMEIRDDGCVAYKEKDQDPPKTGYKYGGML